VGCGTESRDAAADDDDLPSIMLHTCELHPLFGMPSLCASHFWLLFPHGRERQHYLGIWPEIMAVLGCDFKLPDT
jgi:hypothetical protein